MIVGCIIGSGIFLSPTGVQEKTNSVGISLLIWLVCGLASGVGAYCYAELGTLIRKSGGDYAYVMEAFGPFWAFMRLWVEAIIVRPCNLAIISLTFAKNVIYPFYGPAIQAAAAQQCEDPRHNNPMYSYAVQMLAASMLILITVLNSASVKWSARVQDVFAAIKTCALVLIILCGGYWCIRSWMSAETDHVHKIRREMSSFQGLFENPNDVGSIVMAFYSVLFAYQGWNYLNVVTEELINPKRNLPLSIAISTAICTLIYVLVNAALYVAIDPAKVINTKGAAAVEFGVVVFERPMAAYILIPFVVACSTFGAGNGTMFTSSRFYYVGAREKQMPLLLAMVNKRRRTPIPSVIFCCLLSFVYLAMSENAIWLVDTTAFSYWLAIAVVMGALLYLRYTLPDAPRPVKVNLAFPIGFLLFCVAIVLVPIVNNLATNYDCPKPLWSNLKDTSVGLLLLLIAVPVWLLFIFFPGTRAGRGFRRCLNCLSGAITRWCQKLLLVTTTEDPEARKKPTTTTMEDPEARKKPTTTTMEDPEAQKKPTTTTMEDPEAQKKPTTTTMEDPEAQKKPTTTTMEDPEAQKKPTKMEDEESL